MNSAKDNLIRELLLLYVKYGAATFAEAIGELRQTNISRVLTEAALEIPRLAEVEEKQHVHSNRKVTRQKKLAPKELANKYVADLSRALQDGSGLIAEFVKDIIDRSVLTSPALLHDFSDFLGLPTHEKYRDRYTSAVRIGEYLQTLSPTEAADKIKAGRNMIQSRSALEAWTNVIVRKDPENKN